MSIGALFGIKFYSPQITLLCFLNHQKNIVQRAYPELDSKKFSVIPHKVIDMKPINYKQHTGNLCIGILGSINNAKGLQIIKRMADLIRQAKHDIRIVIIGVTSEPHLKHPIIKVTGPYQREQLEDLIKQHNISIFLVPSICPETFSYTSEEIMKMNLPLAVFDIGAPPERVRNYPKGLVIARIDAAYALGEIIRWFNDVYRE